MAHQRFFAMVYMKSLEGGIAAVSTIGALFS